MEAEDKYTHPNWRGLTKAGRKRPQYADKSTDAARLRMAGAIYARKKRDAKTADERRLAWEEYTRVRDLLRIPTSTVNAAKAAGVKEP